MMQISYAQNFEDVMLWRALGHVGPGTYVDIGANDPVVDSVTRWFYEQGWQGLNVEPVGQWLERLREDRPRDVNLGVAVSNRSGPLTFFDIRDTGLATLDPEVAARHRQDGCEVVETTVPVEPLDALIRTHLSGRTVHFLKIDVEGAEREVLESTALSDFRPWIIVVEATVPRSPVTTHQEWEHLLLERGYQFAYFDGLNRFYVADEQASLIESLRTPPNTFDNFMRHAEAQARSEVHLLRQQLLTLQRTWQSPDMVERRLREAALPLEQHLDACRRRIAEIEQSTSWRITAPLRALRASFQPVPETGRAGLESSPAVTGAGQSTSNQNHTPAQGEIAVERPDSGGTPSARDLLLHQVEIFWRAVDRAEALMPVPPERTCALCGHQGAYQSFKTYVGYCQFGGGRLDRYQCPACDVIFGPNKMLALRADELAREYDWHYRLFSEGDSTEQELRAFFSLDPRRDGIYLNYGAGAWSHSVRQLREQGWNVIAYEPTPSVQQREGLITDEADLRTRRFDGIYSNNVLEHLRDPVSTLRQLASLLNPGGRMSHATPCYEYLYEYTRFHLFFYLGRSRQLLADRAGLEIDHATADGHFINIVFQPGTHKS